VPTLDNTTHDLQWPEKRVSGGFDQLHSYPRSGLYLVKFFSRALFCQKLPLQNISFLLLNSAVAPAEAGAYTELQEP
jgi:hypothetical protein